VRRILFALAAIGGLAALVPSTTQTQTPSASPTVEAAQLAQWIRDAKPGVRIIDHRSKAAFDWYHIPGAELASANSATIIVIADGRELELRGGMQAWLAMLRRPGPLGRYFGGPPRRGGC